MGYPAMVFTPHRSVTNHTNLAIMPPMGRPAKNLAEFPNNLRHLRERKKWTQEDVARMAGMAQQTYQRYEAGERRLKADQLPIFAHVFGVEPAEVIDDTMTRQLSIVGYVGAGAEVYPIDDLPEWNTHYVVNCPREFDPSDTEALIVEGDSMLPIEPRSIVFISKSKPLSATDIVGKLCVVQLSGGRRLLKQVRRGYQDGRFNLISTNAPPIEDVEIQRAAHVRAIMQPGTAYLDTPQTKTATRKKDAPRG